MPDLVAPVGEIRDLDARADAPPHALGAGGEPPHRARDGAGQQHREHHHHAGGDEEHLEDRQPLGLHHLVDVAALGREQQRAAHGAEALHRHRDRDDHLAAVVDAHHAGVLSGERLRDLRIAGAVLRPELPVERQIAASEPGPDRDPGTLEKSRPLGIDRRQVEAHHVAAPVEIAAVEQQHAFAVVDARARLGRRHQPAQHRRHPLGIDREFDGREPVVGRPVALARVQLHQPFGRDRDRVGLDRRRGRDGAGDDLALHLQALHARVDQAGAELREVKNPDDEGEQSGDVEKDDAPGEAGKALGEKELPRAPHQRAGGQALDARSFLAGALGLDDSRIDVHSSIEHLVASARDLAACANPQCASLA